MKKIAIYGKGGIGKSTIASNLAIAFAKMGLTVMQIGCDPKADSTFCLRHGEELPTILDVTRKKRDDFTLEEVTKIGYQGVICVEAGGPIPGLGCAGRGIITALEKLEQKGAYEVFQPDIVLYDVLGDVVCGGFSMPMRSGYADKVYIITSGENMSIYAAANISMAIENFKGRGYASLGGFILNERKVEDETKKVETLCQEFHSTLLGNIERSKEISKAEAKKQTVLEAFPDSTASKQILKLAQSIYEDIKK